MKKVLVGLIFLSGTFFAQETPAVENPVEAAAPPAPANQTQVTASPPAAPPVPTNNQVQAKASPAPDPAPTNQAQAITSLTNVSREYSITNNLKPIGQSFSLYYVGGNQQIMGFKYGLLVHNKKHPASAIFSIGAGSAFKIEPLLHLLFEAGFMYKISNRYSFGATVDFSTMLKTNYKLGLSFKSRFDYVLLSLGGGYDFDKTAFVSFSLGFVY